MNKNIKYILGTLLIMMFVTFTSCDEVEDSDVGGTSVESMSGDWYVQLEGTGDYYLISTYNTALNDGTDMWIDDHKNFWWFKAKTPVNVSNLTFGGNDLASSVPDGDDTYDITVSISNGLITKGVTTPSGNPTDGITFDIVFSDGGSDVYQLVGYKRTGFAEDEH